MERHIAVAGWIGNPSRASEMLQKYAPEGMTITFIGELKPFTKGYDLILNFFTRPDKMLILLTCSGVKVARVCGSDWYKALLGKRVHRFMLRLLGFNLMYASEELKNEVGLKGEVHVNPVNVDHFYPRDAPRDKEVCYYVGFGRSLYCPEKIPIGATLIDGSIPYEDMPELLSRHKRYVRWTTHDASPKLPYEAFLCGCEVVVNGERLTTVPDYMYSVYQMPRWVEYISRLLVGKL